MIEPPEAPELPPVDPRFRARRIEVARAKGRRRLKWLIVIAAVVVVLVGGGLILRSPLLSVDHVSVSGVVYTDPAAVAAVVHDLEGQPMVELDTGAVERRLEALPWVLRAEVTQHWPKDVHIDIKERTPVAVYGAVDGRWRVVDTEGRVLAALAGRPVDELLITLTNGAALAPGQSVPANLAAAVRVARALPPTLAARVGELRLTANGEMTLVLQPSGTIVLGTSDAIRDKLIAALTVMARVDPAKVGTIDVRSPASPVLTGGAP